MHVFDLWFSKFRDKRLSTEIHLGIFAFQICIHSTKRSSQVFFIVLVYRTVEWFGLEGTI